MTKAGFRSMMEEVLSVPTGTLKDSDTRDSVPDWSSLCDVQIMAMVSSELRIHPDQEIQSFQSVGELLKTLERRGALEG